MLIDEWLRDLPQQFQNKKNVQVLIWSFAKQLQEVMQVFDDLNTATDIDNAVGQNLNYVGTIIPLSRKEAGELAGNGVTDPVISDERYRQFLKYKNLVNTNECTYYDLIRGITLLWNLEKLYYIEDAAYPATIIFQTDRLNLEQDDFVEFHSSLCIRASGVGILLRKLYEDSISVETVVLVPRCVLTMEVYSHPPVLLNGVWFLDGEHNLSGYDDGSANEYIHAAMGLATDVSAYISVDEGLMVEKDLWYMDGACLLDGSVNLDADIYEIIL